VPSKSRNVESLAELIPWVPELFRDLASLLPEPDEGDEEEHIWLFGERRVEIARALTAQSGRACGKAALIDTERDRLFAEREALGTACMGFLRDMQQPSWSTGLPRPVQGISASFCLSRLSAGEAEGFLREARLSLREGGVFFWIDFFLPQSLSLLARYQQELAKQAPGLPANAIEALLRERNLLVLENALQSLTESRFSNVEIAAKRMNLAAIAAYP